MVRRTTNLGVVSLLALIVSTASHAQEQADGGEGRSERGDRQIVVTGNRSIVAALSDLEPEQTFDEDSIASYAVNSVGELIDEIAADNGDEEPALLVNGEPVTRIGDISDYPPEAVLRIEVLPRGSARRIGGAAGQRAYNIVLRRRMTSLTPTLGHRLATEGSWTEERADIVATHIRNRDRLNLSLRVRDSDLLLETDRAITQPISDPPYDPLGNIVPLPRFGTEIDPALSLMVGFPVRVAAVPSGTTEPSLTDFAAGANEPNTFDLGQYRSLRPANRNYRASLAGNKQITPWLSAAFAGTLEWDRNRSLSGLPSAVFLVPSENTASPFSRDVLLALSDAERPLQNRNRSENRSLSLTLNGNFGDWRATASGGYNSRKLDFWFEFVDPFALLAPILVAPQRNPFSSFLGASIPVSTVASGTDILRYDGQANIDGPLFDLPTGQVRLRATALAVRNRVTLNDGSQYSRTDFTKEAGVTIPITSRDAQVLPALGNIDLSLDAAHIGLSNQPSLSRHSASVAWRFRRWLRFNGSLSRTQSAVEPNILLAPVTIEENVPTYDPLRDEDVDVTFVYGGNPDLLPETEDVSRLSATLTPLPKYNLRVQADYSATRSRDLIGSVPAASPEAMAAFPDRFIRNATGRLVRVDERPVNFAEHKLERLRYGIGFRIPFYSGPVGAVSTEATEDEPTDEADTAPPVRTAFAARPRPRLDVSFNHTILLSNTLVIRPELPPIDLMEQQAAGIGGVTPQHRITGTIGVSDRGTGVRANGTWRSATSLVRNTGGPAERLRFGSLATFNVRLFAEAPRIFPGLPWAKGARLSLTVANLTNARQRVTDPAGETPLSFQPAYRDPLGRTMMFEIRKVF